MASGAGRPRPQVCAPPGAPDGLALLAAGARGRPGRVSRRRDLGRCSRRPRRAGFARGRGARARRWGRAPAGRTAWLYWRLAPAIVPAVFLVAAIWGAAVGVPGAPAWLAVAVFALAGGVALGIVADRFAGRARLQAARARAGSRIEIARML